MHRSRRLHAALVALAALTPLVALISLTPRDAGAQSMPQCVRDPNTGRWISPVEGQACSLRPATSGSPTPSLSAAADLGSAIGLLLYNKYGDAAQRQVAARLAADRAARAERERVMANEAARRREEIWSTLSGEFRFTTEDLELRLGSSDSLQLRSDDDTASVASNKDLMLRNTGNCFFLDCGERYEMPAAEWSEPYVDLRHLSRAAHLVRKTLTAPGDQRESLIDQSLVVAQGGYDEVNIPDDGVRLPPNALDLMVGSSVTHKLATDARLLASAQLAALQQRHDLVVAVADQVRADASLDAARRADNLRRLQAERDALDAAILAASARVARAKADEDRARMAERETLVGATISDRGGPVENCQREQEAINAIRAGFPRMDSVIAKVDVVARQEHAEARQSIAEAKGAGLATLDPLKEAIQAQLDARIAALKGARVVAQGPETASLTAQLERAKQFAAEMQGWATKGAAVGGAAGAAAQQANGYDAMLTFLGKVDDAGLLSPLAGQLAENPAIAARELGPWVALGDAFIRTAVPTADAVLADRRAAEARELADRMREHERHLRSLVSEREARLGEIQRAGGCIAR